MWFIQTSVDALSLPTDSAGRTVLTGQVPGWHHIVRFSTPGAERNCGALVSARLQWSIWPWQQNGSRIHLDDSAAMPQELLQMVRNDPHRACSLAEFRADGKRTLDATLQLSIVVPPEQFIRYETLIRFAMTLPSGTVSLTLPEPVRPFEGEPAENSATFIAPGEGCLMEGLELAVARAKPKKFTRRDLQADRRVQPSLEVPAHALNEHGDEWYLFRRDEPQPETNER
ncbi:MAG: hypothetical protein M3Y64_00845 [Gemmatimonadota bacterium]|nr:hypothetical protein [Gemmatimonadota bacterium]